jgi:hypothetical protein
MSRGSTRHGAADGAEGGRSRCGIRHREIGRIREVEVLEELQAPGFAQGNVLKHRHIQNARVGAGAWCCAPRC